MGWDPRGVGHSTPVACMGPADLDRYYALDSSPDNRPSSGSGSPRCRPSAESCLKRSGELLEHISTVETVRDLELLRHLVGDAKINYFGSSYGTRIGALYAELYPARVGRMVLDGSVNISGEDTITQTEGFERALNNFAGWCAAESCRLGDSRAEVLRRVKSYLDQLDQRPMPVGNRTLTQQQGVEAVYYSMYGGLRSWARLRDVAARRRSSMAMRAACSRLATGPTFAGTTAAMTRSTTPSRRCAAWTARTTACAKPSSATTASPRRHRCSDRSAGPI